LDGTDREVLRVFLASRGNMKELERHLGVSYPTARARFDDLLRKLDLGSGQPGRAEAGSRAPGRRGEDVGGAVGGAGGGAGEAGGWELGGRSGPDPRLATLQALASGELNVEDARRQLAGPSSSGSSSA
jgi:hypothetical protein